MPRLETEIHLSLSVHDLRRLTVLAERTDSSASTLVREILSAIARCDPDELQRLRPRRLLSPSRTLHVRLSRSLLARIRGRIREVDLSLAPLLRRALGLYLDRAEQQETLATMWIKSGAKG
jgi:hypothetical protein